MSTTITTHQADVDARLAARGRATISAASPSSAAAVADLQTAATDAAYKAAEAERAVTAACREIETKLQSLSRLNADVEALNSIRDFGSAEDANRQQAAEYFLASQTGNDPNAIHQFRTLTDHVARISIIAPAAPGLLKSRHAEIATLSGEIASLSETHSIDVPALVEFLRKQRAGFENVVWSAPIA